MKNYNCIQLLYLNTFHIGLFVFVLFYKLYWKSQSYLIDLRYPCPQDENELLKTRDIYKHRELLRQL